LVFALLSGDDAAVRATASLDINDLVTVLVAVGVGVVDASLPAIIMLFVFEFAACKEEVRCYNIMRL
jgi:hypothetical protein